MSKLTGRTAWITGAGRRRSAAGPPPHRPDGGAIVVLTGRRETELTRVADAIRARGGAAHVRPGDATIAADMTATAAWLGATFGRVDILVNNAGANIAERSWADLTAAAADQVIAANLTSAFICATAVLPIMRSRRDGLLIHTASWAGRHPSPVSGAAYSAAKQGLITMSHLLNAEECVNGIRSCAICPAEVATPILDRRPVPVPDEERARMLQPSDLGDLIRYVATLPPHVCLNEVVISPTWNRMFAATAR